MTGGTTNNALSLAGSTITSTSLTKVGFAGFVSVKIKHVSGGELTVDVPVSVVDDSSVITDDVILSSDNNFQDYVFNVPESTSRKNYVMTQTNAIAWNPKTGASLTSNIEVSSDQNFMTINPMVVGQYTFKLTVKDTQVSKVGVIGNIISSDITASGLRQYCEGETISLQVELNDATAETFNWYYQPVGGTETLLTSSSKTFTKATATNANTGYYIARLVKNSSVQTSFFRVSSP